METGNLSGVAMLLILALSSTNGNPEISATSVGNLTRSKSARQAESYYEKYEGLAVASNDLGKFKDLLSPILKRRVSGTPAHAAVRQHVSKTLTDYGFTVWHHEFKDRVPVVDLVIRGQELSFTNIVATYHLDNTNGPKRKKLILACHYDSLYAHALSSFVGATDSAVPCAILLDIARVLAPLLSKVENPETTLQLIFFDGEEAFKRWSDTDSLYGSRKLASEWQTSGDLQNIDAMILLDLLGTDIGFDCVSSRRSAWVPFSGQVAGINNRKDGRQFWTSLFGLPKISSYMQSTQNIYDKFLAIQDHLRNKRLLVAHDGKGKYCKYFRSETAYGTNIADDHVPFMNKGVKILHAIVSPFPSIWHTDLDRDISLHWPTIQNLNMIFRIGVADYLGL